MFKYLILLLRILTSEASSCGFQSKVEAYVVVVHF